MNINLKQKKISTNQNAAMPPERPGGIGFQRLEFGPQRWLIMCLTILSPASCITSTMTRMTMTAATM